MDVSSHCRAPFIRRELTSITVRHGSILVMDVLNTKLHACMHATYVAGTHNPHSCRVVTLRKVLHKYNTISLFSKMGFPNMENTFACTCKTNDLVIMTILMQVPQNAKFDVL